MPFALTKKFQSSISLRIAFLFCFTFAVGLVCAFIISYFQIRSSLEESSRNIVSAKLQEVSAVLKAEGVPGLKTFLSSEQSQLLNSPYLIRVISESGELLYVKPSIQEKQFDLQPSFDKSSHPAAILGWQSIKASDDEDKFILLTEKASSFFYVQVGTSSENNEDILDNIFKVFAAIGAFFIFLSTGASWLYAKKSLAPLRSFLSTIQKIENGDLGQRVPPSPSHDELRDLGETFNAMISRIEKLVQMMTESLDNVAHEIKTPLTRIRAVAENALLSKKDGLLEEALEDCAESATKISELTDQLMSISEAEAGILSLQYESCEIKTLLQEVSEVYEFVAHEKNLKIQISDFSHNLVWNLDARKIKQCIANLVDNAIKFSPENRNISLSAVVISTGLLKISVIDQGVGVPATDLPRIWDRLFRADKSRSTKGLGLGLSLVRAIISAHGGSADCQNLPEGGMVFSIFLPPKAIGSKA